MSRGSHPIERISCLTVPSNDPDLYEYYSFISEMLAQTPSTPQSPSPSFPKLTSLLTLPSPFLSREVTEERTEDSEVCQLPAVEEGRRCKEWRLPRISRE